MLRDIIKSEREKLGLTQLQLSKELNVSQQAVGSWEIGRTEPNLEVLQRLADVFNVSTDYLLERVPTYDFGETNKSALYEANEKYLSIDEQLNLIIELLENSEQQLFFRGNPLSADALSTLLNSLQNIVAITEKINKL